MWRHLDVYSIVECSSRVRLNDVYIRRQIDDILVVYSILRLDDVYFASNKRRNIGLDVYLDIN